MSERERMERDIDYCWRQIHELTQTIEGTEKLLANSHVSPKNCEEEKATHKHANALNERLNALYEEKRRIRMGYKEAWRKYKEQQNLCNMAKLIAKRKQELINLRAKEEGEKRSQARKCEELMQICGELLAGHAKDPSEENPQNESSKTSQGKKNKKKKQKKAEALAITIELDRLRERFQSFGVSVPDKRGEIEKAMETLGKKLKEIEERPLSKTIPVRSSNWEEHDSAEFSYDVNGENEYE